MSIEIGGHVYYRTAEVCGMAGISKNTYLRWVREGVFKDVGHRDRRGWRLFTEEDLARLKGESNRTI
jgi:predicted site-specific integrase-resolvase